MSEIVTVEYPKSQVKSQDVKPDSHYAGKRMKLEKAKALGLKGQVELLTKELLPQTVKSAVGPYTTPSENAAAAFLCPIWALEQIGDL